MNQVYSRLFQLTIANPIVIALSEGDVFNEYALVSHKECPYMVVATTRVELLKVSLDSMEMIKVIDPSLSGRFYNLLSRSLARLFLKAEKAYDN